MPDRGRKHIYIDVASTEPGITVTIHQCTVCKRIHAERVDAHVCCDEEKLKQKKVRDGQS